MSSGSFIFYACNKSCVLHNHDVTVKLSKQTHCRSIKTTNPRQTLNLSVHQLSFIVPEVILFITLFPRLFFFPFDRKRKLKGRKNVRNIFIECGIVLWIMAQSKKYNQRLCKLIQAAGFETNIRQTFIHSCRPLVISGVYFVFIFCVDQALEHVLLIG